MRLKLVRSATSPTHQAEPLSDPVVKVGQSRSGGGGADKQPPPPLLDVWHFPFFCLHVRFFFFFLVVRRRSAETRRHGNRYAARMTISATDLMAHCTAQSSILHDPVLQRLGITLIFPTDEEKCSRVATLLDKMFIALLPWNSLWVAVSILQISLIQKSFRSERNISLIVSKAAL